IWQRSPRRRTERRARPRCSSRMCRALGAGQVGGLLVPDHEIRAASTTEGLPVAPSLGPGLATVPIARHEGAIGFRTVLLCALSIGLAFVAALVAEVLTALIGLITNLAFFGRFSTAFVSPAGHHLGVAVIGVPIAGAIVVGLLARFGSPAIRGHGIP